MEIVNKRVLVIGLGLSGISTIKLMFIVMMIKTNQN